MLRGLHVSKSIARPRQEDFLIDEFKVYSNSRQPMRLTAYTDYALRVLMHVALRDGERVRIVEIADSFGISHNHLTKVVHNLATHGCLKTVQGRNGGMQLARPPAEITVGQIVRAFEPDFRLVDCFEPKTAHCVIQPACVLKSVFQRAAETFLHELDQVTLADLLQPRPRLTSLLDLPAVRSSVTGIQVQPEGSD